MHNVINNMHYARLYFQFSMLHAEYTFGVSLHYLTLPYNTLYYPIM